MTSKISALKAKLDFRMVLIVFVVLAFGTTLAMHSIYFYHGKVLEGYPQEKDWIDLSLGFSGLSLTLLIASWIFKVKNFRDIRIIQSPNKIWKLWLLMNAACLCMIPSSISYFIYRQWRFDYPSDGDSILIPIMGTVYFTFNTLFTINMIFLSFSYFINSKPLPRKIFSKFPKWDFGSSLLEFIFGSIMGALLFFLIGMIFIGDMGLIGITFTMIYVTASLRSCFSDQSFFVANEISPPPH